MTALWVYAVGAALTLAWEAYRLRRVLSLRVAFVAALWPLAWLARAGDLVKKGETR